MTPVPNGLLRQLESPKSDRDRPRLVRRWSRRRSRCCSEGSSSDGSESIRPGIWANGGLRGFRLERPAGRVVGGRSGPGSFAFVSATSPEIGANRSETALTDSTTPKV